MEERIDLYDLSGQATGRTGLRSDSPWENTLQLVVTIWVRDGAGRILLTRRHPQKRFYPLRWETTGGMAQAGEGPYAAARRELREETGLIPQEGQWRFLGDLLSVDTIDGVTYRALAANYLVTLEEVQPALTLQPEEVQEARWVTPEELLALPEEALEPFTPQSARRFWREITGF